MGELEKNGGTREEWGTSRRMGELEKNGGNQKRIGEMVQSSKSRSFVSLIPV